MSYVLGAPQQDEPIPAVVQNPVTCGFAIVSVTFDIAANLLNTSTTSSIIVDGTVGQYSGTTITVTFTMDDNPPTSFTDTFQLTTIDCTPSASWYSPSNGITAELYQSVDVTLDLSNAPSGCDGYSLTFLAPYDNIAFI